MRLMFLTTLLTIAWGGGAWAQNWGEVAQISSTLGVQPNRLCLGEASRGDIGCPAYAPFVSSSGYVGLGTISTTERLTVRALSNARNSYPVLLHNLSDSMRTGYGVYGLSNRLGTAQNIEFTMDVGGNVIVSSTGSVGIGQSNPSTTLHVSGTLRVANGGEACDVNRAGAMRFAAGVFEFCDGTAPWKSLGAMAAVTAASDRIVSGSTSVVASQSGGISFTTAGVEAAAFSSAGQLTLGKDMVTTDMDFRIRNSTSDGADIGRIVLHSSGALGTSRGGYLTISGNEHGDAGKVRLAAGSVDGAHVELLALGTNSHILLTTNGYVGVGRTDPSATLDVSGSVKVAGTGAEICGPTTRGSIRQNPVTKKLEICRY